MSERSAVGKLNAYEPARPDPRDFERQTRPSDSCNDLRTFSDAIINQSYQPDVYLLFCALNELKVPKYLANSKVCFDGEWASFIYTADPISVNVVARSFGPEMFHAWNPRFIGDEIVIQEF